MNKTKLYWTFQVSGWTFYAAFLIVGATMLVGTNRADLRHYTPFVSEALVFFIITHAYRYIMQRYGWLLEPIVLLIPRVIVASIFLGLSVYFIRVFISYLLGLFQPQLMYIANIVGNTLTNTMVIFLWSLFYFMYHYFDRYNRSLKYEAALNEIELNQLKSQLNPHFIFNALNSIRALVDENPIKSKNAINQLSSILRNTLISDKKKLTRFEDEIRTVKDYLGLETIRFEERLQTSFDIQASAKDCLIPPLMIQTLVENGIKHGISKLVEGGNIHIKAYVLNNRLKIEIRNSGKYVKSYRPNKKYHGLGIENTRQRLKLIFGDEAMFTIFNENENTVLTKLSIPQQIEYESTNS